MDRGAWRATVHGVAELDTTEGTTCTHTHFVSSHFVGTKGSLAGKGDLPFPNCRRLVQEQRGLRVFLVSSDQAFPV